MRMANPTKGRCPVCEEDNAMYWTDDEGNLKVFCPDCGHRHTMD